MKGSRGSGPVNDAIRACGYVFRFDVWVIYGLSDPLTGALRYVGYAKNLAERLKGHFFPKRTDKSHRANWIRSIKRLGLFPKCSILYMGSGPYAPVEREWIARMRVAGADLVNGTDGGDGALGRHWTPEASKRLSASLKGHGAKYPQPRKCLGCGIEFTLPQKRRARVKHCSRACWLNHSAAAPNRRITDQQRIEIQDRRTMGESLKAIGNRFQISISTVSEIARAVRAYA